MRIHQTFDPEFDKLYNNYCKKYPELMKCEGIDRSQLDLGVMSKRYFTEDITEVSIDTNANANEDRCPNNYTAEITKGMMKLEGYYLLWHYAQKRFDLERANELIEAIWKGDVYFHDASGPGIQMAYCYAFSTNMIMHEGRLYGQLHSLPPKRADSFLAQCAEITMDLSQEFAGAIAPSDILVNYAWYAQKENLSEFSVINDFQKFVHIVNNKFRVSSQSPFTNISLFDRPNLEKVFEHYTYPDGSKVDIEYVIKLEKMFGDWFSKGDPDTNLPYRFPIVTCLSENTTILIYKNNLIVKDSLQNLFGHYDTGWSKLDDIYIPNEHGKPVKINKLYKQHVNEPLYNIEFYNGYKVQVTANHKFETKNGLITADNLHINDYVSYCNEPYSKQGKYITELFVPDFVDTPYIVDTYISNKGKQHEKYNLTRGAFEQLQRRKVFPYKMVADNNISVINTRTKDVNDKVKCSIPTYISIDERFGYFLGLFLAEGHVTNEDVKLSFNIKENEYINFIDSYISNTLLLQTNKITREECNSVQIGAYSSTLGKVLMKLCGKGACNKFISSTVFNFRPNVIKSIIRGWLDGDGHTHNAKIGNDRITGSTCSKQLAIDMQILMKSIGINSYIRKQDNCRGFGNNGNIIYELHVSSGSNEILNVTNNTCIKGGIFYYPGWIQIKSIELFNYTGFVYDICVDSNQHLYTLPSGIVTHNCNIACNENGEITDQDFLDWTSKVNLSTGCFNIYVNSGSKIASCCRLVNDVERMQYRADTFGNGGLSIGSHRVVTINLPRIAERCTDIDHFENILHQTCDIARDLLLVHRYEILRRRIDQGFLKFFNPLKWFSLDHLFSTIGIIGVYEMNKFMGIDITSRNGIEFTTDVLNKIEELAVSYSRENKCSFNVEEIPGESVAIKFCQKDNIMFGENEFGFKLYSNQYIPLIEDALIPERIQLTGQFQDILSGGGILHINMQDQIKDPADMKHLIEYSVKNGVSHFAVNYGFGKCENGHTTVCGNSNICAICGAPITDHYTRIVGYFTHVDSWNSTRREFEFPRRVFGELQ
jgi:anaerobic ribonucleoside-triphosphate reductase